MHSQTPTLADEILKPVTEFFTCAGHREIAFCQLGDPEGIPVFYAHGAPSSKSEAMIFHRAAYKYGFRLIASDRPGFGESEFAPNRRLLDYPQDMAALADSLNIETFGVLGWSAGAAHTIACAYAIPDRLRFNITVAGYTNFKELPNAKSFLANSADRFAVSIAHCCPPLFRAFFTILKVGVDRFPNQTFKAFLKQLSPGDIEIAHSSGFKDTLLKMQQEAFSHGSAGVAHDARIHYADWGFKIAEIIYPLHIIHGRSDRLVPYEFGEHLSQNIQNATLQTLENEGHFYPYRHADPIFKLARDLNKDQDDTL
ncbi:MAG: alpha/beta hydrolase [Paracoccaceae bacterium]